MQNQIESTDPAGGAARRDARDNAQRLKPRDGDRRGDGGLFGGYSGPERRSGRDRRDLSAHEHALRDAGLRAGP